MASLQAAARSPLFSRTLPSAVSYFYQKTAGGSIRAFGYQRHKRLLKHAKGYRGKSKNCFTVAIRRVQKAWQYAYRDRKVKKREWRRLWIQRISAGGRQYGLRYSRFIAHMRYCNITLNRKVLSEMASMEPFAFKAVVDVMQAEHKIYTKQKDAGHNETEGVDMVA